MLKRLTKYNTFIKDVRPVAPKHHTMLARLRQQSIAAPKKNKENQNDESRLPKVH